MAKRQKHKALEIIISKDEHLTKLLVSRFLQYPSFKTLKTHCKSLEISCNGIVWLSVWLTFIYLFNKKDLCEMQINMLFGLIMDIFLIAIIKSICRRRRPTVPEDMLVLGPDKFSFPSGHASRASFVAMFFICLCPISKIWWMPLTCWCLSVCLSRILMQRHYILDVLAGCVLGFIEIYFLNIIWISESTSQYIINFVANDELPIDVE
ncbi:inactive phospholipid phosphatase 7 [Lucilia sericata]|uniref:inactive phospholipid phosphatase 7 n=1 Tax=Lucilia sericata TaxID=13632 RepID=UPI0018A8349A|nr:inactive phospholipid phosphatase 7 [Lucilia sericata]